MAKNFGAALHNHRANIFPQPVADDAGGTIKAASVAAQIHRLFQRQHQLYAQENQSHSNLEELAETNLQWERCWKLWCQEQPPADANQNPVATTAAREKTFRQKQATPANG